MSGYVGEVPKRITRGWIGIPDKNQIIMTDTKTEYEDSYEVIDGVSQNNYQIIWNSVISGTPYQTLLGTVFQEIHESTVTTVLDYREDSLMLETLGVSELYFKYNDDNEYFVLKGREKLKFPGKPEITIGINSNIYKKIRVPHEVEYIHPHFGLKKATIKKAWIGDDDGNPREVLTARDYFIKDFSKYEKIVYNSNIDINSAVVISHHNKLHAFISGRSYATTIKNKEYYISEDGYNWTYVNDYDTFTESSSADSRYLITCCIYNDEIHLMVPGFASSGDEIYYYHVYLDETTNTWIRVGNPISLYHNGDRLFPSLYSPSLVNLNNVLYFIGFYEYWSNENDKYIYVPFNYKSTDNGTTWTLSIAPPKDGCRYSAVVYSNKIHLFGTYNDDNYYHYTFAPNATSWAAVSVTVPDNIKYSRETSRIFRPPLVYNNEILIRANREYYSFNGSKWTLKEDLWYGRADMYIMPLFIYNNHLMTYFNNSGNGSPSIYYDQYDPSWQDVTDGISVFTWALHTTCDGVFYSITSDGQLYHYDIENDEFVKDAKLSFSIQNHSCLLSYDHKVHLFMWINSDIIHYEYNGTNFVSGFSMPQNWNVNIYGAPKITSFGDKFYMLCTKEGGTGGYCELYIYDKLTGWSQIQNLPSELSTYTLNRNISIISYNGCLHIFILWSLDYSIHYIYKDEEFKKLNNTPIPLNYSYFGVFKNKLHIFGSSGASTYYQNHNEHYIYDDTTDTYIESWPLPSDFNNYYILYFKVPEAYVFNNEMIIPYEYKSSTKEYLIIMANYYWNYF